MDEGETQDTTVDEKEASATTVIQESEPDAPSDEQEQVLVVEATEDADSATGSDSEQGEEIAEAAEAATSEVESLEEAATSEVESSEEGEDSEPEVEVEPSSVLGRFLRGMKRSREAFAEGLARFMNSTDIDEAALESLEDTLVGADIGVRAAMEITEKVRTLAKEGDASEIKALLRHELLTRLGESGRMNTDGDGPKAILVVGVNGSGKTTTIGKLAARYRSEGKKVLLAAGDTFRAGAIEQLKVWGERAEVPVIAHHEGGDPAAVIFDALQAAQAREVDLVICDTAGRLQAQQALMDELAKVVRVMGKAMPGAPHEVLLVLDSTIGQNAISQARSFKEVVGVTGIALTKLDGTARGGVVVAICDEMDVPVKLVGLGEGMDDLRDFESEAFVEALLGG
jgi:fused signal recognition particle receptor